MNTAANNANFEVPNENNISANIDFEDYLKIDAVSNSQLKKILVSPAHSLVKVTRTPDMLRGSIIDCAALEPEYFDDRYVVAPCSDKRKTEYKDFAKEINERKNPPEIISQADFDLALIIAQELYGDHALNEILLRSRKQITLQWQDEITLDSCKGRPDFIDDTTLTMYDLKSTRSSYPPFFEREITDRCYHMQAAFYLDGYNQNTADPDKHLHRFKIVAVEKTEPYGFRIFEFTPSLIDRGRALYRQAMQTLMQARLDDHYPKYDTTPIMVGG